MVCSGELVKGAVTVNCGEPAVQALILTINRGKNDIGRTAQ